MRCLVGLGRVGEGGGGAVVGLGVNRGAIVGGRVPGGRNVLERAGVVISPGGAYGPNGEGFFRISLTTPEDRLLEALQRLREV